MDIQNITNLSTTHAQVALEAYVKYGSCQFHSNDKENSALTNATNGNGVFSGKSDISDTSTKSQHVYSVQNSAPVTSVGTANTPIQFDAGRSNMLVMTALDAVLVRSLAL